MSILRKALNIYRKIQYMVHKRAFKGMMNPGVHCDVEPFMYEENNGDIVHPCVRYIKEGYEGHCWWMVYTPYYNANDKTENPILCYAESNDPVPPTQWKVYCQVQGQPEKGYNSDPVLLYSNNILYVLWRENETTRCEKNSLFRATFGGEVHNGKITNLFGPVVGTEDSEYDSETCPTFIEEEDGTYRCLAMSLTFHSKRIKSLPKAIKKPIQSIVKVLDLLGLWSQQKSHGIAQWSNSTIDSMFRLDRTIKFQNKNALYRPWHMDFFSYEGNLYSIVQTNQCNADICLAKSTDRINFRFYNQPLMTNATCGKLGIYKPTGGVINNVFYLYYTAQDPSNRKLNKLYLTTIDIDTIMNSK